MGEEISTFENQGLTTFDNCYKVQENNSIGKLGVYLRKHIRKTNVYCG